MLIKFTFKYTDIQVMCKTKLWADRYAQMQSSSVLLGTGSQFVMTQNDKASNTAVIFQTLLLCKFYLCILLYNACQCILLPI